MVFVSGGQMSLGIRQLVKWRGNRNLFSTSIIDLAFQGASKRLFLYCRDLTWIFPKHLTPWLANIPWLIGPQDDTNKIGQQIKHNSTLWILNIVSSNSGLMSNGVFLSAPIIVSPALSRSCLAKCATYISPGVSTQLVVNCSILSFPLFIFPLTFSTYHTDTNRTLSKVSYRGSHKICNQIAQTVTNLKSWTRGVLVTFTFLS